MLLRTGSLGWYHTVKHPSGHFFLVIFVVLQISAETSLAWVIDVFTAVYVHSFIGRPVVSSFLVQLVCISKAYSDFNKDCNVIRLKQPEPLSLLKCASSSLFTLLLA